MEHFEKIYDCYGNEMCYIKCETINCEHKASRCGDIQLSHCNKNNKCMSRNIQDLVIENKKLREKLENYKNFYKL